MRSLLCGAAAAVLLLCTGAAAQDAAPAAWMATVERTGYGPWETGAVELREWPGCWWLPCEEGGSVEAGAAEIRLGPGSAVWLSQGASR